MFRRVILATSAALVVAIASGIITTLLFAGPWQDVQSSTGNVTAQSGDVKALYICDRTGTPHSSTTDCPATDTSDDSGADEIIFENPVEGLTPGGAATAWDIRMRNITTGAWDIVDLTFTPTETLDPQRGGVGWLSCPHSHQIARLIVTTSWCLANRLRLASCVTNIT